MSRRNGPPPIESILPEVLSRTSSRDLAPLIGVYRARR